MPAGSAITPEPQYSDPCFELYIYLKSNADAKNTPDGYYQHTESLRNSYFLGFLGYMSLLWLFAIALLYGAGMVVAWVTRGFRPVQDEL